MNNNMYFILKYISNHCLVKNALNFKIRMYFKFLQEYVWFIVFAHFYDDFDTKLA